MDKICFNSEKEMIDAIRFSPHYNETRKNVFNDISHIGEGKRLREKYAWSLIVKNRDNDYTKELLSEVFDTVDFYIEDSKKTWFGVLIWGQNKVNFLSSSLEKRNQWIKNLLFSDKSIEVRINNCFENKIKGAKNGLISLLLYLSNPEKYNIWLPAQQKGLFVLGYSPIKDAKKIKGLDWGSSYCKFNSSANNFKNKNKIPSAEIDWWLWFIGQYVWIENERFCIHKDILNWTKWYKEPPKNYSSKKITLPRKIKYCDQCGASNRMKAKFCINCGEKFEL